MNTTPATVLYCETCPAENLADEAGYAHSREFGHCVVDAEAREVYCRRADH